MMSPILQGFFEILATQGGGSEGAIVLQVVEL
jgi:hypothetical protein